MRPSLRFAPLSFVLLLVPASAVAQAKQHGSRADSIVEAKTDSGYEVWFPVDTLGADGNDPNIGMLRAGTNSVRRPLMRPRLQFIPEMLKSVETL
jgi:hypothetical protein